MESSNDFNSNLDAEANKRIAIAKRPLTFYDGEKHAFVPIDPEIIDKLKLTRKDEFTQVIVPEGILLRHLKETI